MVELVVDRIVAGGTGLAQLDGLKVFVPFAAPQERVRARITVRKKDYAVAQIAEILEPSPIRVPARCPFYGACGGCQLQHLSYEGQLIVKKLFVNDALQRIGRVFVPVRNISGRSEPWRYRNKTQYPVQPQEPNQALRQDYSASLTQSSTPEQEQTAARADRAASRPKVGFYRQDSHVLLDIPTCLLHPEAFDRIRAGAVEAIFAADETAYDERNHKGNIRHLMFRTSGTETVVTVSTRTQNIKPLLVERLAALAGVSGIVQTVNPDRTNRILGNRTVLLAGRAELHFQVLDKSFRVSPLSFFQVNTGQAEELCRKVLRYCAPTGGETVLDLYSGVGMLTITLAGFVGKVVGCEIEGSAIADARFNAELAGADNVEFIAGDVDNVIASIDRADIVVLDPPRKGASPATIKHITRLRPDRVVYVSCNPATLARDLKLFEELGYQTTDVEPTDMFPQTFHVEVVTRLERKRG